MAKSRLTPYTDLPFEWRLDFTDIQTGTIAPAWECSISSVTDIIGTPVTNILLNGGPYSFGDIIINGDIITVTVSVASVIDLNFDF